MGLPEVPCGDTSWRQDAIGRGPGAVRDRFRLARVVMTEAVAPSGDAAGKRRPARSAAPRSWWWSKHARNALKIVAHLLRLLLLHPSAHPRLPEGDRRPPAGEPGAPAARPGPAARRAGQLLLSDRAALPRGSVSGGTDGAHPALDPGAGQRRARRQRGGLRPRLPAAHPVGVKGPDAGFALATAGLGSAVVLNIIFWTGLLVSIPLRGVNPFYGTAAIVGADPRGARPGARHRAAQGPGEGRADPAVTGPSLPLRRGPRRQRRAPDRPAPPGAGVGPEAAQRGHGLGHRQLAARCRVPLGVPAGLRRQRSARRADRGLRAGQHPVPASPSRRVGWASSKASTSPPWSASG